MSIIQHSIYCSLTDSDYNSVQWHLLCMEGNYTVIASYSLPLPCKNILCPICCHVTSSTFVGIGILYLGLVMWLALANEESECQVYLVWIKDLRIFTCVFFISFLYFSLFQKNSIFQGVADTSDSGLWIKTVTWSTAEP